MTALPESAINADIDATHFDGMVLITVTPDTARRLSNVWAADHAGQDGPWPHDVINLRAAATLADIQRGHRPASTTARGVIR